MVTVLIPTINRSEFIIRTLRYFAALKFSGKIIIGDSSIGLHSRPTIETVTSLDGQLDVRHVDCVGLNGVMSFLRINAMVDTPYVAYLGDDDLFVPSGLQACVEFLESNPGFIAANGEAWAFRVRPDGPYGEMEILFEYPQPDLPQSRSVDRVKSLLGEYRVGIFSVHRVAAWNEMWRDAGRFDDRSFGGELVACCMAPILGRIKHLEGLFLFRQTHEQTYHLPSREDWLGSRNWTRSFKLFCEILGEKLHQHEGIPRSEAESVIEHAFMRSYLRDAPTSDSASAASRALPERDIEAGLIRRVVRSIPGLRILFRECFRLAWRFRSAIAAWRAPAASTATRIGTRALIESWTRAESPVRGEIVQLVQLVSSAAPAESWRR